MYSELFETIIRTSGENTDDVNSPEPDNFWAENRLFEQILKEAGITPIQPASPVHPMPKNFPKKDNTEQDEPNTPDNPNEKDDPKEQEKKKPFKEPHLGNIIDQKI
jgi:hypothetical protein